MASRPSPPKPHELRSTTGGVSAARMTEFERARATSAGSHFPTSTSTATTPTLPPRPGGGLMMGGATGPHAGGYGSAFGSGATYGTSSYGGGYGTSRYGGGGYGSTYGSGGYGSSLYGGGGYGSAYGGGGYGSGYGTSRYGSRYGSTYGGGGGYGSGAWGSSTAYGGGYGAYNRGGAVGMGPRGPGEGGGPGVVTWIDQFAQVVDTFGRFAHLLDMNCDALYGSFSSVLRLFESMSELRREFLFIFQTVTLYRVLKSIVGRFGSAGGKLLTGAADSAAQSSSSSAGLDLDSFQQFQGNGRPDHAPRGRRLWPFLLFLISAIGGPLLLNRLWRMLRSTAATPQTPLLRREEQEAPLYVQALYDFAGSEGDLNFDKGAMIRVLRADPDQGWWEGESGGRVGLFPANFVQPASCAPSLPNAPTDTGRSSEEPIRLHLAADRAQPRFGSS